MSRTATQVGPAPVDDRFVEAVECALGRPHGPSPATVRQVVTFLSARAPAPFELPPGARDAVVEALTPDPRPLPWRRVRPDPMTLGDVYAHLATAPPATVLRWTALLEAFSGIAPDWLAPRLPGGITPPDALLAHAQSLLETAPDACPRTPVTYADLERVYATLGVCGDAILVGAVEAAPIWGVYSRLFLEASHSTLGMLAKVPDIADALARHAVPLEAAMMAPGLDRPGGDVFRLLLLARADDAALARLAAVVADRATSRSRDDRRLVTKLALLDRCGPAAEEALEAIARTARPDHRARAFAVLGDRLRDRGDVDGLLALRAVAGADRAEAVREVVRQWDEEAGAPRPAPVAAVTEAELAGWLDPLLDQVFTGEFEPVATARRDARARERLRQDVREAVQGAGPVVPIRGYHDRHPELVAEWIADGAPATASAVVLLRLLSALSGGQTERGLFAPWNPTMTSGAARLFDDVHRRHGRPGLAEIADAYVSIGCDPDTVWHTHCAPGWGTTVGRDWPAADVQPYLRRLAATEGVIDGMLAEKPRGRYGSDRELLFAALAHLDPKPPRLVRALFGKALGGTRVDGPLARAALSSEVGLVDRVVAALRDGRAAARRGAAGWLADLGAVEAVPALTAALATEKQEATRAALLDALERLADRRPVS